MKKIVKKKQKEKKIEEYWEIVKWTTNYIGENEDEWEKENELIRKEAENWRNETKLKRKENIQKLREKWKKKEGVEEGEKLVREVKKYKFGKKQKIEKKKNQKCKS